MKINCLTCGHKIDVGDSYDDYEGHIKCYVCESLLDIKSQEAELKSVKFVKSEPIQPSSVLGN